MASQSSRAGKFKRWVLLPGLLLLAVIQFIPYGRSHGTPLARVEPAWDRGETRTLFMQACGDCHSYETRWPWYSRIAPVSWLVQSDVNGGRKNFNVQEWGRSTRNKGKDAAEALQEGEMPPWYYKPLHAEARLSAADKQRLIDGLAATFGRDDEKGSGGKPDHDEDRSAKPDRD